MKLKLLRIMTVITLCLFVFSTAITSAFAMSVYTVVSGDSLWKISSQTKISIADLKTINNLTSDTIYVGQRLNLVYTQKYIVVSGDTLWLLAQKFKTTIGDMKALNKLSSDMLYIGQVLLVPKQAVSASAPAPSLNTPVKIWPSVTYIVQAGDTLSRIAAKFNSTESLLFKYNYMAQDEWLNEGQKLAINGYAPRNWDIPGEAALPARPGKLADWFYDGQYVLNRTDVFLITDYITGLQFSVKMMGGVNHADVEPLSLADTAIMQKLFSAWVWAPRPVVIFHKGMNIASSLSGMPHSFDTIAGNNVSGHFDLYLLNSTGTSSTTSAAYIAQHQAAVRTAAGLLK